MNYDDYQSKHSDDLSYHSDSEKYRLSENMPMFAYDKDRDSVNDVVISKIGQS